MDTFGETYLSERTILFFDGSCGLCNRFVQFILKRDVNKKFFFAPLHGHTATQLLEGKFNENIETVVLFDKGIIYISSDAIINILLQLGWGCAVLLKIIPRWVRDCLYRVVAKYRHKFFSPTAQCDTAAIDQQQRFLP